LEVTITKIMRVDETNAVGVREVGTTNTVIPGPPLRQPKLSHCGLAGLIQGKIYFRQIKIVAEIQAKILFWSTRRTERIRPGLLNQGLSILLVSVLVMCHPGFR